MTLIFLCLGNTVGPSSRYFADSHFLKASRGDGSSFICMGIHTTKENLFKGYRWVVGDGTDIIAAKDLWLGSKKDLCVDQSHIYVGRNEIVSNFFIPVTKQYDARLVRELFHEEDAKPILATYISQRDVKDTVA